MSSSLHKMQAARLPNAQHTHPRLITRHAANSLFDFIDVLKIYGGRRSSEAEIMRQRLFHPSPGDHLPSSVLLLGPEGWGALLHDRRAVATSQVHGVLTQHTLGLLSQCACLGPKQHWVCRNKIFAFLCCHLSCVLLLQNKPSATGHAPHLHPLLQTILLQPPASPFPENTP